MRIFFFERNEQKTRKWLKLTSSGMNKNLELIEIDNSSLKWCRLRLVHVRSMKLKTHNGNSKSDADIYIIFTINSLWIHYKSSTCLSIHRSDVLKQCGVLKKCLVHWIFRQSIHNLLNFHQCIAGVTDNFLKLLISSASDKGMNGFISSPAFQ